MLFVVLLVVLLVLLLVAIELVLWGALLALVAVIGLILHGAGVLETVADAVVVVAILAAAAWAAFWGAKALGMPFWLRFNLSPPPANLAPSDPHERYLWANRLGPYADDA